MNDKTHIALKILSYLTLAYMESSNPKLKLKLPSQAGLSHQSKTNNNHIGNWSFRKDRMYISP